ncbi:class I SAM-dependent methyltransferase [Paenibacillus protaetiae]|uniref:Class I SAM-dependent methyltransferase n=1 Tax=Paenibacillus protaetiae TaxID=2509456 RepID=A0A4P6EZD6_9BACL|nr:class I SAM-dependent methyltransferase [Paenibacillus protaetiae]QAY67179.1 class I SAM-dependent methyltransferase [Paenibacillus protaetiae]
MNIDSKERFTDRVEAYVKYRPGYPEEAISYLYDTVGLSPAAVIADIGAGTGIFSRILLERGSRVIGVEPNDAMRSAAVAALGGYSGYEPWSGAAEATGLADNAVDFITCAQSFHWFDRPAAQQEFGRILKPGGKAVLIWNSRLTGGTPFLEGYEQLLRQYGTDYEKLSHKNIDEAALEPFFKPGTFTKARFTNSQKFDLPGLEGRLLSSSYAPMPGHPNHEPMLAALKTLFDETGTDGTVSFDYETEIYWGEV